MLYIMVNEDRPDGQPIREATRDAHLAYLERPVLSEDVRILARTALFVLAGLRR